MSTNNFIRMMFTVDFNGNRGFDSRKFLYHTGFCFCFFQLPYSDVTCLECVELLLHVQSMQLSLIF